MVLLFYLGKPENTQVQLLWGQKENMIDAARGKVGPGNVYKRLSWALHDAWGFSIQRCTG